MIIFLTGGPRERLSQLERIATAFAGLGGPVQQLVDLGITGVQSRGGGAQTLRSLVSAPFTNHLTWSAAAVNGSSPCRRRSS